MSCMLYITADRVGQESGGGKVTYHEAQALKGLGETQVWDREVLERGCGSWRGLTNQEPWVWDEVALGKAYTELGTLPRLAHFYAGTFTRTVLQAMKQNHVKVSYTAAAHDIYVSRRAHEELGVPYNYPHITDYALWRRYLDGYKQADKLICPSMHSLIVMHNFGCTQSISIIPHGVDLPPLEKLKPLPERFRVGYLGAYGPDKGVRYLLEAWAKLDWKDATLMLAGRDSISSWVLDLVKRFGGSSNIVLGGWQPDITEFYNQLSLYVQPSLTEGFGIEVSEAMAHGRPVLCSEGAGASDLLSREWRFPAGNVEKLVQGLELARTVLTGWHNWLGDGVHVWRQNVLGTTWPKIEARYQEVWKEMLK